MFKPPDIIMRMTYEMDMNKVIIIFLLFSFRRLFMHAR